MPTDSAHPPLTEEEEADRLAGDHYERDLIGVNVCVCGAPWICPEWTKAVIANG